MNDRSVVTGTVLSQFGESVQSEYSPYASLPPELARFVDQLAKVEYPVTSKAELLEKLGGAEARVFIGENAIEALHALMFIPANFFPMATPANFSEKLSDYYAMRRPAQRTQSIDSAHVQSLAQRFLTENSKLVVALAKALQKLNGLDLDKLRDQDDKVAARFLEENQRLVQAVSAAFAGIGRLRAKAREESGETQGAAKKPVSEAQGAAEKPASETRGAAKKPASEAQGAAKKRAKS